MRRWLIACSSSRQLSFFPKESSNAFRWLHCTDLIYLGFDLHLFLHELALDILCVLNNDWLSLYTYQEVYSEHLMIGRPIHSLSSCLSKTLPLYKNWLYLNIWRLGSHITLWLSVDFSLVFCYFQWPVICDGLHLFRESMMVVIDMFIPNSHAKIWNWHYGWGRSTTDAYILECPSSR